MDSRLQKITILVSLAAVLLVSFLVILLNRDSSGNSRGGSLQSTERGTAGSGSEAEQGLPGQIGTDLSAFETDSTFFDPERNAFLDELMDQSNRLSLFVTSVEKDLRIQILDQEDRVVTGESFYVTLDGIGDFKDLDQDGVIYIGDLNAGEYYVSLNPIEGYRVPENETRVRVKEKVEYIPIEDISLLIKTEDEIDAEAEDTGGREAEQEADGSEIRDLQQGTKKTKVGIDVSKWQGDIDWQRVKEAGVEFAIIRAGYRGSTVGALIEDPCFESNMRGAAAAGIPTGVYFFTQATNEVEAVEEASMVLELIRDFSPEYPIFIDTEGAGGNGRADGLDVETRTLVCEAFCRTIRNAGYTAGVYASKNWYQTRVDVSKLEKYVIWLAEYRSAPSYEGYYEMWQHTSKGSIDGIDGNVDLDISYR